jgi:hypothetical protein
MQKKWKIAVRLLGAFAILAGVGTVSYFLTDVVHRAFFAREPGTLVVTATVVNDDFGTAKPADVVITVMGDDPQPASFPGAAEGTEVVLGAGDYAVTAEELKGYAIALGEGCTAAMEAKATASCGITADDVYKPFVAVTDISLSPPRWSQQIQAGVATTSYTLTSVARYKHPSDELPSILGETYNYYQSFLKEKAALVLTYHLVNADPKRVSGSAYGEAHVSDISRIVQIDGEEKLIAPPGIQSGDIISALSEKDSFVVFPIPIDASSASIAVGDLQNPVRIYVDFAAGTHKIVRPGEE